MRVSKVSQNKVEPSQNKGIKKTFYDQYNDKLFGQHTTNQSLQKKLERFRNNMAVDFYNLLLDLQLGNDGTLTSDNWVKCKEKLIDYADKYVQWDQFGNEPIDFFGDHVDSRVQFVLKCAMGSIYLLKFKTITDKVLASEMLSEAELAHLNKWVCGQITQRQIYDFSDVSVEKALKDISLIQGIPTDRYMLKKEYNRSENYGMVKACLEWVVLVSQGTVDVGRCEAEDCNKLFIPEPRGKKQKYCSETCKKRAFRTKKLSATIAIKSEAHVS